MKSASQLVQTAEPGGGADTFMGPAGTTAHVTRPSSARLSAGAQSFAAPSQLLEDLSISASNASKQQLLRDAAREVLDLNAIPSPKGGSGPQNGASRAPRNSLPPLPASAGVSLHDVGVRRFSGHEYATPAKVDRLPLGRQTAACICTCPLAASGLTEPHHSLAVVPSTHHNILRSFWTHLGSCYAVLTSRPLRSPQRHTPPFGWEGAQAGQHHTTAARPLSASRSGRQQVRTFYCSTCSCNAL